MEADMFLRKNLVGEQNELNAMNAVVFFYLTDGWERNSSGHAAKYCMENQEYCKESYQAVIWKELNDPEKSFE